MFAVVHACQEQGLLATNKATNAKDKLVLECTIFLKVSSNISPLGVDDHYVCIYAFMYVHRCVCM